MISLKDAIENYANEPIFDVFMEHAGPNKRDITKLLLEYTELSLDEIRKIVDSNGGTMVIRGVTYYFAKELEEKFTNFGAIAIATIIIYMA